MPQSGAWPGGVRPFHAEFLSGCPPAALAEVAGSCSETEDVVMASPDLEDAALEESAGPLSDEDDDEDRFLWFCHSVVLPEVLVAGVSPA